VIHCNLNNSFSTLQNPFWRADSWYLLCSCNLIKAMLGNQKRMTDMLFQE